MRSLSQTGILRYSFFRSSCIPEVQSFREGLIHPVIISLAVLLYRPLVTLPAPTDWPTCLACAPSTSATTVNHVIGEGSLRQEIGVPAWKPDAYVLEGTSCPVDTNVRAPGTKAYDLHGTEELTALPVNATTMQEERP